MYINPFFKIINNAKFSNAFLDFSQHMSLLVNFQIDEEIVTLPVFNVPGLTVYMKPDRFVSLKTDTGIFVQYKNQHIVHVKVPSDYR